ncbi:MAG: hypothetical protein K2P87_09640 [Lachnospiraceae bacterium]|nr:hypothetical protein [Lachnospiraceae bacterium]
MEYIVEMIFWVVLAVVLGLLGSSRREEKKVDPDKTVMRYGPSMRYGLYMIGILIGGMFGVFGAMAIRDRAHEAEPGLILLILLGVLAGIFFLVCGYILYARHVFFDEEELIVGRPFKSMLHVKWQEVSRMECKGNRLLLYGADGRRLLCANAVLENFDLFSDMAKRMCSARMPKKDSWQDGQRVMTRRTAAVAMFCLAGLLFIFFAVSLLIGKYDFREVFTSGEQAFMPVMLAAGAAALLYGVVLFAEKIRYTKEEITFYRLSGKKNFLWRNLKKIRREEQGSSGVQKLCLTWEGKEYVVSKAKYQAQYEEFLDFIIDVALERDVPISGL